MKRILVVDDEVGFTHLLRLTLEGTGKFEVEEVSDGRKAVETARYFKPDIVFLDVMMPEVDGGDVARKLRADPETKSIPVVFLTAIVSSTEASHRDAIGGFPFLAKPVSLAALEACIEDHCG